MSKSSPFPHFATLAIHEGQEPEQWTSMAVVPPVSFSTTFKQKEPGVYKYDYSRGGNPTRDCLERCIAALDNAKLCAVYSSGLAATTAIFNLMQHGDHMLCCDDVYGGTNRYIKHIAIKHGITCSMLDMTDLKNVEDALLEHRHVKMVWIETPTNPTLKLVDIAGVTEVVRKLRHKDVFVVVDNTFLSPYFQRPLDLGADITMNSITKYINGHSDVVMGCASANDDKICTHLRFEQKAGGYVPSPMDCFLVNRGIKTLHVRMERHQENAYKVADYLMKHPKVEKVIFPAHPSHPQYELFKKQCKGWSGMLTFYIRGGLKEAKTFLQQLKVFTLAESLGGFESLAEHPAIMTHASVPPDERVKLGISDTLIRLSVGIEDVEDLIADLDQALNAAV